MKQLKKVIIAVLVLMLILGITKDLIIKTVVSAAATQMVGAKVSIGWMSVGLMNSSVRISGLRIFNPSGFPSGTLIDLPRVNVDYDLPAILSGKMHLRWVQVEMKEMSLVKNNQGQLNVDSLKVVQQGKEAPKPSEPKSKKQEMQIDKLEIKIGRVIMKDYTTGQEPLVQVHDLNIDRTFQNVTSPQQLVLLILAEPMKQGGIKGAAIYGVAMLSGVGLVPVVAATLLTGKDSVTQQVRAGYDRAYEACLDSLKKMGTVKSEDRTEGTITADANGAGITVRLKRVDSGTTEIAVSARKMMLPKPDVANGVLYQIMERLGRKP